MPIRLIIVDDDKLITLSLKMIIEHDPEMQVVAFGTDGSDALDLYTRYKPDLVLLDIRMKTTDGLVAGRQILDADPHAKILYLTTFADDDYIIQALRMGARGYILKQNYESLGLAIHAVMAGQRVFGDDVAARIPDLISGESKPDWEQFNLREREQTMIRLVAEGLNNKEIAADLFLGEGTVRNTLSVILDKLQLRDRTQLAIWYYKNQHRLN